VNLLGCLLAIVIFGCVASFIAWGVTLLIIGTITFLFKLTAWMAVMGACFVAMVVIGLILAKLSSLFR
jgi:hypothetical protein